MDWLDDDLTDLRARGLYRVRRRIQSAPGVHVHYRGRDFLSFAVPLAIEAKQELLEELNVEQRALLLLRHLSSREPPKPAATDGRDFPPGFSPN